MIFLAIVVFILILGIFILAHEGGHFLMARLLGIKVEEFGFGYPPRIWKKQFRGVIYSINAIPFGGFVKVLGVDRASAEPSSYSQKGVGQRLLFIVSGVVVNFLLAILILTFAYWIGTTPLILDPGGLPGQKTNQVLIAEVLEKSPAEQAGLESGDRVLAGQDSASGEIASFGKIEDLQTFVQGHRGKPVDLFVRHENKIKTVKVTPSESPEAPLGVSLFLLTEVKMSPGPALVTASRETIGLSAALLRFLGKFFADLFREGKVPASVVGPVGIFSLTSQAVKFGLAAVLQLSVLLTINLVWINLLPFPALDGSRLLFLLLEGVSRRKFVRIELENLIHTIGFIILIILAMAITYRDIMRLVK